MPLSRSLPRGAAVAALLGAAALPACGGRADRTDHPALHQVAGGDPRRGAAAVRARGCVACHVVPGVRGPAAHVGPPLAAFSRRAYIAGTLPNGPENLVRWIEDPQAIRPGSAMPRLGIGEAEARDIAAYLLTLR